MMASGSGVERNWRNNWRNRRTKVHWLNGIRATNAAAPSASAAKLWAYQLELKQLRSDTRVNALTATAAQ